MKIKLFIENAIETNTWVLTDEKTNESIVIDLGGGYQKILDYIKSEKSTLKYILCTHGHFDHILGACEMQKDNVFFPVYMSKKDLMLTENINDMLKMFGFPSNYEPLKIDKFIDKNTELMFGNKKIKIIETPGHTPGGVCFLIDDMLFSGDTLFNLNIGRCDLPFGDFDTLIESLNTEIKNLDDNIKVYPGHGPTTLIGYEKKHNPYF